MPWPAWWPAPTVLIFLSAFYICWRNRKLVSLELQHLRTHIAADLHDDVGASLSQVAIMSEVSSQAESSRAAALQEIACVSREVLESLSEIVWALDPGHDRLQDLTERMRWFAGETLSARGISLDFRASGPGAEQHLTADARRQIFLIFKECTNNIARHAGASHATITLGGGRDRLHLHVEDDGCGFDLENVARGYGLGNMKQRARLLGGELLARSQPGRGTTLDLKVPMPRRTGWPPLLRIPHEYAVTNGIRRPSMASKEWPHPF
jgi:signal transduction histidine kinase